MQQRTVGDVKVGAIGLGAMPLSVPGHPDPDKSRATVHAALDAGVTLIDTADAYTPDGRLGHNEEIVAEALRTYGGDTSGVLVATKAGHTRDGEDWDVDGRPEYLREAAQASARRLGVDAVGLLQHHRPDPKVPYEETMGGLRALVDEGIAQRVGISNADPDQIRLARQIIGAGLVSVQNQLSPAFRSSLPEVDVCTELGLAFLPWSPLGGMRSAKDLGSSFTAFTDVAQELGTTPYQVCLAWLLARSPVMVPIPGASRPETIQDSAAASALTLTDEQITRLDATDAEE